MSRGRRPLALSLRAVDWPIISSVQIRCAVVRYFALVSDFDGVIAEDGHRSQVALTAIARRRASGRRVILLTGRRLGDLAETLPHLEQSVIVIVANGAVIYEPTTMSPCALAKPPPDVFVERLKEL